MAYTGNGLWMNYYFVTLSSHFTIENMTPMEITQTLRNTVHATQIGQEL